VADEARLNSILDIAEQAKTEGDTATFDKAMAQYKQEARSDNPIMDQPAAQAAYGQMSMTNADVGHQLAGDARAAVQIPLRSAAGIAQLPASLAGQGPEYTKAVEGGLDTIQSSLGGAPFTSGEKQGMNVAGAVVNPLPFLAAGKATGFLSGLWSSAKAGAAGAATMFSEDGSLAAKGKDTLYGAALGPLLASGGAAYSGVRNYLARVSPAALDASLMSADAANTVANAKALYGNIFNRAQETQSPAQKGYQAEVANSRAQTDYAGQADKVILKYVSLVDKPAAVRAAASVGGSAQGASNLAQSSGLSLDSAPSLVKAVQTAIKRKMSDIDTTMSAYYNSQGAKIDALAKTHDTRIPVTNLVDNWNQLRGEITSIFSLNPGTALPGKVQSLITKLDGLASSGQQAARVNFDAVQPAGTIDVSTARELSKGINELFRDSQQIIQPQAMKAANRLFSTLKGGFADDLKLAAQGSPTPDIAALGELNSTYRAMAESRDQTSRQLGLRVFGSKADMANPQATLDKFASKSPEAQQQLRSVLEEHNPVALKYLQSFVMRKALADSMTDAGSAVAPKLAPAALQIQMKRLLDSGLFTAEQANTLSGTLDATKLLLFDYPSSVAPKTSQALQANLRTMGGGLGSARSSLPFLFGAAGKKVFGPWLERMWFTDSGREILRAGGYASATPAGNQARSYVYDLIKSTPDEAKDEASSKH
jgi:hypothetical protein